MMPPNATRFTATIIGTRQLKIAVPADEGAEGWWRRLHLVPAAGCCRLRCSLRPGARHAGANSERLVEPERGVEQRQRCVFVEWLVAVAALG